MEIEPTAQENAPTFSRDPRWIVLAIILLLPLLYVALTTRLQPALDTLQLAQTDSNLLSEASFVGMDNYNRLFSDDRFTGALAFTLSIAARRVSVVVVIPLIIGLLIAVQGRIGRTINRLLLGLLTLFISPVALALLWVVFWGQIWGTEPSPLWPLPESLMLGSPDGARNSIWLLDSGITLALALVVGVSATIAAMRGRREGRWPIEAMLGVWLLGVLLAAGSAFLSFDLPYIITRGGPLNATNTFMLHNYTTGFEFLRFGLASAQASLLIPGALLVAFLIWLIVTLLRLRLRFTPPSSKSRGRSWLSLLSVPLLLLGGGWLVALLFWANGLATDNEGFTRINEIFHWPSAQASTQSSWTAIWYIQVPIALLAGFSLGFLRPLSRAFSSLVFLLLLLITFIPNEALIFQWFVAARDNGLLDNITLLNLPWQVGGLSLLVFKLFFEGAYENYQAALVGGQTPSRAFFSRVLLPALPIAFLIGVVLMFMSTQSLLWPLITLNSPNSMTVPLNLARMLGAFAVETSSIAAGAVRFITMGLPFMIVFVLFQVFVLDRLALLGGGSVETLPGEIAEPESVTENWN